MGLRGDNGCRWWIGAVVFLILVGGCAPKQIEKEDPFFKKWKLMAQKSRGHSPAPRKPSIPIPEEVTKKDLKEEEGVPTERALPVQPVSLKLFQAEATVVLRALARAADQNILISNLVKGKVTVNIEKAPWDEVFRGILQTLGLTYTWMGGIIRVMTLEEMEHDLKMEAIHEKRKSQKMVLRRVEPLMTKVVQVEFADPNKLKESLQGFLTKDKEGKPRGSVNVSEHTNAIIIQAIRDDINKMVPLIQELDGPTPQILIEANIVETSRDTARKLGIQWGGLYRHSEDLRSRLITPGSRSEGVTGGTLLNDDGEINPINPTSGTAANFPATIDTTDPNASWFTIGYVAEKMGRHLLNIQLSALQSEGKLNILSSPSITTIDNQSAIIESGAEVPFQTVSSEGNIQIEWKKATLKLEVTPHVIDGKMLKLKIVTHKDELDFTRTVSGNPTIITKKAETNLILLDGQTTVIGGLSKETTSGSEAGIPGMKDIPLLGYLFKEKSKSTEMEEVLIFITPYILEPIKTSALP